MKKRWIWVLVLALCLSACRQPPEGPTPSVEVTPESTEMPVELPVFSDPITAFYDTLVYDESYACTPFYAFLVGQEAVAWEAEARHIFTYLKENAHPRLESGYLGLNLEQFEADFFDYVEKQSLLDAYIDYTSLLGEKGGTRGEFINYGTGFGAGEMLARIDHYRYFVESWYDNFTWLSDQTPLDWYVFSPEEALARLTEGNGLKFAQGEYLLEERGEPEGERPLENPIDGWVSQWLYQDGSTPAMAADAYREADIWREELCHSYEVLAAHANPVMDISDKIEAARDALMKLAPAYGDAMSLYLYSNAFSGGDQEGDIFPGSLATSDHWRICAGYYRHETLRLWEKILDRIGRDKLTWVFDPEEYEADLPLSRNPALEEWERERLRNLETGRDVYLQFDAERAPFERLREYTDYDRLSRPLETVELYAHRSVQDMSMEVFCQENYGGPTMILLVAGDGTAQEFFMELELVGLPQIGELTVEDINFDGRPDLLLYIGQDNTGGAQRYAAFLKEGGKGYRYEPSFTQIGKPRLDTEHKVIWGGIDHARSYTYDAYEVVGNGFRLTHRIVVDHTDVTWEDVRCTEYIIENESERIVGQIVFPGDRRTFSACMSDYISHGSIWEGWNWCVPSAYEREG